MDKAHKQDKELDAVDRILMQWQSERPDLDTTAMGLIGRLKRSAALIQPKLESSFKQFGLTSWEFDVLATLCRSGSPYALAPTVLFSTLMITSGTMTHRMAQLEKRGLVERKASQEDARSKLVQLTPEGLALINQAVSAHVDNEREILSALNEREMKQIEEAMKIVMKLLEN